MGGSPRWLWFSRFADAIGLAMSIWEARMSSTSSVIDSKVAERAMLNHPFYQAWTEGRLPLDTLRSYAWQYFHHVELEQFHFAPPASQGMEHGHTVYESRGTV